MRVSATACIPTVQSLNVIARRVWSGGITGLAIAAVFLIWVARASDSPPRLAQCHKNTEGEQAHLGRHLHAACVGTPVIERQRVDVR
jgi:hypothetical protein